MIIGGGPPANPFAASLALRSLFVRRSSCESLAASVLASGRRFLLRSPVSSTHSREPSFSVMRPCQSCFVAFHWAVPVRARGIGGTPVGRGRPSRIQSADCQGRTRRRLPAFPVRLPLAFRRDGQ